ncbi:MAG: hypothetical protein FJ225_12145 [Lentisphaerae bacterium]|nr:hypothetical protein [Lentisphaerota bacterium]
MRGDARSCAARQTGFLLLDLLFFASLLAAPAAWLASPLRLDAGPLHVSVTWGIRPLLAPPALLLLRAALAALARRRGRPAPPLLRKPVFRKAALGVAVTFAFFLGFEQVLAWAGFEARLPPIVIRGEDDADVRASGVIPDPELRWKYNPGVEVSGKIVNSLGFRDREVRRLKPPGAVRVICMGCSCTAHGTTTYAEYLHAMLSNAPPTAASWEAFNMGVTGYSSVQGLRLFEKLGRELAPDFVTIYYGWNDHWRGGSAPDSNRMALRMSRAGSRAFEVLRGKRFGQLLIQALTPGRNVAARPGEGCLRVPREEYVLTLSRFIREARRAGAVPVVITAPRASKLTKALVRNGQVRSVAEGIALHDEYAELTRRAARENDAVLLDLAGSFLKEGEYEWDFFKGDGIHQEPEGRRRIAERIYALLRELGPESHALLRD